MLNILIGHTCSGTSYLLNKIKKDKRVKIIYEHTDRPKRNIHETGYVFCRPNEFEDLDLLTKVTYQVADPEQLEYSYGISKDLLKADFKNKEYIIRTNVETAKELIKILPEDQYRIVELCVVTVNEIKKRISTRENQEETKRRINSDFIKLEEFEEFLEVNDLKHKYHFLVSDFKTLENFYKVCDINV